MEATETTSGGVTTPTSKELLRFIDRWGSTYALVNRDSTTTAEQTLSFDAFGLRRRAGWGALSNSEKASFSDNCSARGYAGHLHVDSMELIYVDGRLYDPTLGRFLSSPGPIPETSPQGVEAITPHR